MKNSKNLKGLIIIGIGLAGLITTLIVNSSIENDWLCIVLMTLFLIVEIYGLSYIIKEKFGV